MDQHDGAADEFNGSEPSASGPDRILTVPNFVSVSRVLALPLLIVLIAKPSDRFWAAVLAGLMGFTDFLDGYLARGTNQVSTVGKVLDPACDRIVLIVSSVALWFDSILPHWLLSILLVRELLVTVGVIALAAVAKQRFDVVWIGKLGTFILLAAVPFAVLATSTTLKSALLYHAAEAAVLVGTAILYVAAYEYVRKFAELIKSRGSK